MYIYIYIYSSIGPFATQCTIENNYSVTFENFNHGAVWQCARRTSRNSQKSACYSMYHRKSLIS